jgi:hypothetical protein
VLWWHEHLDTAWSAGLTSDQACTLQRQNHLMDGRRSDAEAALDVGLGGWRQVHAGVGVDERQVLPLLGCKAGLFLARHFIHLRIQLRLKSGAQMNVRYRVTLTQYERDQLGALLSGNGTANLFVFLDTNRPWRKVKVTERRTAQDFAVCIRELTDIHCSKVERIRVVLDNLSTHTSGA